MTRNTCALVGYVDTKMSGQGDSMMFLLWKGAHKLLKTRRPRVPVETLSPPCVSLPIHLYVLIVFDSFDTVSYYSISSVGLSG